jgi:hypothetical protein
MPSGRKVTVSNECSVTMRVEIALNHSRWVFQGDARFYGRAAGRYGRNAGHL